MDDALLAAVEAAKAKRKVNLLKFSVSNSQKCESHSDHNVGGGQMIKDTTVLLPSPELDATIGDSNQNTFTEKSSPPFLSENSCFSEFPLYKCETLQTGHERAVTGGAYDRSGSCLVTSSLDTSVCMYDFSCMGPEKKVKRRVIPFSMGSKVPVQSVSFSTDGRNLAVTGDAQSTVAVLDRKGDLLCRTHKGDGYILDLKMTNGHVGAVNCVDWDLSSRSIFASGSEDGTIRTWDCEDDTRKSISVAALHGRNKSAVKVLKYCDATPSMCIVSCHADGLLRVHDVKTMRITNSINFKIDASSSKGLLMNRSVLSKKNEFGIKKSSSSNNNQTSPDYGSYSSFAMSISPLDDSIPLIAMHAVNNTFGYSELLVWDARMLTKGFVYKVLNPCAKKDIASVFFLDSKTVGIPVCGAVNLFDISLPILSSSMDQNVPEKVDDIPNCSHRSEVLDSDGIVIAGWHPKLYQMAIGTSSGSVVILYDPKKSTKGIQIPIRAATEASPRSVANEAIIGPESDLFSAEKLRIINPVTLPLFRDPALILRGEKNGIHSGPAPSLRQALHQHFMTGGQQQHGTLANPPLSTHYPDPHTRFAKTIQSLAVQSITQTKRRISPTEDPREAVLKYAKLAAEDPKFIDQAYRQTQPVPIYDTERLKLEAVEEAERQERSEEDRRQVEALNRRRDV